MEESSITSLCSFVWIHQSLIKVCTCPPYSNSTESISRNKYSILPTIKIFWKIFLIDIIAYKYISKILISWVPSAILILKKSITFAGIWSLTLSFWNIACSHNINTRNIFSIFLILICKVFKSFSVLNKTKFTYLITYFGIG